MAGPRYIAESEDQLLKVELDGLTAFYHRPSGMTHLVAPPAPQILEVLAGRAGDVGEIIARVGERFDLEPSPLMGCGATKVRPGDEPAPHGLGGGDAGATLDASDPEPGRESTPPQPLPLKGRGSVIEAMTARLAELEAAGLVRRA